MTTRTVRGWIGKSVAATAAAMFGLSAIGARAQAPAATPPAAAPAANDPFTLQNIIGDAVSLSNQAYPDVEKAIGRFKNGDFAGAREYLEIAKKQFPKLPPTEVTLAKLHYFNRDGQNWRAMLELCVTKYPDDPEAYLLLADQDFTEGRTAESAALFDVAAGLTAKYTENEKRKKNFDVRVLAGQSAVLERRAKWDQAQGLLAKWVEVDPDSAAAHTRLGITLFRLKKPAEAIAEFTKARELRPDSPHPQIMLGQMYTADNNIAEARKALEAAYAAEPKNEGTARAFAMWLIQQDQLPKAQEVAQAMRAAMPDSIAALTISGAVAKMLGKPKDAEEAFMKVLTLDPGNAEATNLLALILGESASVTDHQKALSHAQVNARLFPQSSQANITLSWILFKLGRTQEAEVALQRGAQAGQLTADTAYLVARILVDYKNRRDDARKALEQVLTQAGSGMFMYRREAEALLKEVGGTVPKPGTASSASAPAGAILDVAPSATGAPTPNPPGGATSQPGATK